MLTVTSRVLHTSAVGVVKVWSAPTVSSAALPGVPLSKRARQR
jgi:hypothetical protein